MAESPEIVFDESLAALSYEDRLHYRCRQSLDKVTPPELGQILRGLQIALNKALGNETHVPEHRDHPPFHLDYIDSDVVNAVAFQHSGYAFVGLTTAAIFSVWDSCFKLSNSEKVASLIGIASKEDVSFALQAVLFRLVIYLIVSHEYTHHVHGHQDVAALTSPIPNKFANDGGLGIWSKQIEEADADAYAAWHVIANFVGGASRAIAVELLKLDGLSTEEQDDVIFSCFAVAVGAFLILRQFPMVTRDTVFKRGYPPPAARLNVIMKQASRWFKQNRPGPQTRMTSERFEALLTGAAEVCWEGDIDIQEKWADQVRFLKSPDGLNYLNKLDADLNRYITAL